MFEDITSDLARESCRICAGGLTANAPLADITWFRVGGPAQVLFTPADEADLAYFLKTLPDGMPIHVIGLGSNLLVRDGGVPGIVIRLGRGFGEIKVEPATGCAPARLCPTSKLRARRQKRVSAGLHSIAAFRDRSAARCA